MTETIAKEDSIEEGELEDGEIEDELPTVEKKRSNVAINTGEPSHFQFQGRRHETSRTFPQEDLQRAPPGGFWVGQGHRRERQNASVYLTSPGARLLGAGNRGRGRGRGRGGRGRAAPRTQYGHGGPGPRERGQPRGGNQTRPGRGRGSDPRPVRRKAVQEKVHRHYKDVEFDEDERKLEKTRDSFEELLREHRSIQAKLEALEVEEERTQKLLSSDESGRPKDHPDQKQKSPFERNVKGQNVKRLRRSRSKTTSGDRVTGRSPKAEEDIPVIKITSEDEDDDEEMSELQLRLIALESATRKVTSKAEEEEVERQELEGEMEVEKVAEIELIKISSDSTNSKEEEVQILPSPMTLTDELNKKLTRRERSRRMKRKIQERKRDEEARKRREAAEIRNLQNGDEQYSRFLKFVGRGEREIESRMEATEIRKLTNPDEKFQRFMKFVHREDKDVMLKRPRSSSREDSEKRPPLQIQQELPIASNDPDYVFQFDNYEQVEMDVDSSENSSMMAASPIPFLSGSIEQSVKPTTSFDTIPIKPQEESQVLDKPITVLVTSDSHDNSDDEEVDVLALREQLLKSMAVKRASKSNEEVKVPAVEAISSPHSTRSMSPQTMGRMSPSVTVQSTTQSSYGPPINNSAANRRNVPVTKMQMPKHERVVITLGDDSDSSESETEEPKATVESTGFSFGIDMFLKEARKNVDASKAKSQVPEVPLLHIGNTPEAVDRLGAHQKAEYRRLKHEIAMREFRKKIDGAGSGSANASPCISDADAQEDAVHKETVAKQPVIAKETAAKQPVVAKETATKQPVVAKETVAKKPTANEEQARLMKDVTDAEAKLVTMRKQLKKDKQMMVKLNFQMSKKQSVMQYIVNRIQKLKEQLQATEDVLHANTVVIKKLETQRVTLSSKIERRSTLEERLLARANSARQAAGMKQLSLSMVDNMKVHVDKGPSTSTEVQSSKKAKVTSQNVSRKMTPEELTKEKERLQRLEREFAEKIKKLREAQALKDNKNTVSETMNPSSNTDGALQRLAEIRMQTASLKPSMQEYKKDKISIDVSVETEEVADEGPQVKKRRKSLLEMNPSTKPNLSVAKEKHRSVTDQSAGHLQTVASNRTENSAADKENTDVKKMSDKIEKPPKETQKKHFEFSMPAEQQLERLKRLQHEKEKIIRFETMWTQQTLETARDYMQLPKLQLDIHNAGANLNKSELAQGKMKTLHFETYRSPLQHFRSYRFNPYYRTKAKLSLSSATFSNKIDPHRLMCRFDVKGTCNDEGCSWQHKDDYSLSGEELFQDIVSSAPRLSGVKDMENITEYEEMVAKYVKSVFKQNGEKMTPDQMCLLFVSKVNDHHKHVPPHTMLYEKRKWKPRQSRKKSSDPNEETFNDIKTPERKSRKYVSNIDVTFTEEDPRYFMLEGSGYQDLESAVLENPSDIQMWLKLAYQQLSRKESDKDSLDKALNVLSRGLEGNGSSPELWQHYLTLFARRGNADELREMCQDAVHFAPHYDVWSKCLELEKTFSGKDDLCKKILVFLQKKQEENFSDLQSHQILEILLHRIHLHIQTRRYSIALNVFSTSLAEKADTTSDSSCLGHLLTPSDRCLAWLSFIYLTQFHTLPPSLYAPINSNPAKIVCKEPFILPWNKDSDLKPEVLLGYFQNALDACIDPTQPAELNTLICLPLYKNVLKMKTLLGRYDAAETLCRQVLKDSPFVVEQWLMLADLHVQRNQIDSARQVFEEAIVENPFSVELCYTAATFELSQENPQTAILHLDSCVKRLFHCDDKEQQSTTEDFYRKLLGQTVSLDTTVPCLTEDIMSETSTQQLHLWLSFCLVMELVGDEGGCVEAFETALYALKSHMHVQRVWIQYLKYQCRKTVSSCNSTRDNRLYTDLITRCLVTMPTQFHPPFSMATLWSDYSFHNRIVDMYMECVTQEDRSTAYEKFLSMMPNNAVLALRACQHELKIDNPIEAERICSAFLTRNPNCLPLWKVAISLELKQANYREVHRMYWSATQALPFSATLWKDFILFEVAHSNKAEDVKEVIDVCQQIGINIEDYIATILK